MILATVLHAQISLIAPNAAIILHVRLVMRVTTFPQVLGFALPVVIIVSNAQKTPASLAPMDMTLISPPETAPQLLAHRPFAPVLVRHSCPSEMDRIVVLLVLVQIAVLVCYPVGLVSGNTAKTDRLLIVTTSDNLLSPNQDATVIS